MNFKVKTERNPSYLRWLLTQRCVGCGKQADVYHHASSGGMGIKGSDMDAIPLCHEHHTLIHQHYSKRGWFTPEQLRDILDRLHNRFEETL